MGDYAGAEQVLVDGWIESRFLVPEFAAVLEAIDPGLSTRVYQDVGPETARYPFIVYQCQSPPRDVRGVGVSRVMVDTLYVVKAVSPAATYAPLVPVASAIDRAMTSAEGGSIFDGLVFASVRTEQYSMTTREQGETFRHLGGEYRIQAQG
jgi:hypothetical protein